jgi:glucosamine 6-phosphate synthetase-like amidotransferase/phosphosugar isomerase protein
MNVVFRVLAKLEVNQYEGEKEPVGGYGAGVAVLLSDGDVISQKVGKAADSPVAQLAEEWRSKVVRAPVLIGHVRFPSSQFMSTVKFKEAAQPYVENFEKDLTVVSAHNGMVENYSELKSKLKNHVFESEKVGLVDSEIIPHYFGELLNETGDTNEAVYTLLHDLKGSGAIALLQIDEENSFLHLVHKGKTKGLTVWTNDKNEVIFCSRPEPVTEELSKVLAKGKFTMKVAIKWREDAGLKLSYSTIL